MGCIRLLLHDLALKPLFSGRSRLISTGTNHEPIARGLGYMFFLDDGFAGQVGDGAANA